MSVSSQQLGPTTTQPSHNKNPVSQDKPKAGASWKAAEQHVLPYNRLWIVFTGFMACTFLAALDQVYTHLHDPVIVDESLPIDHRCHSITHYRRASWWGKKLQLGWQVYTSFPFCRQFCSPLSARTCSPVARSPLYTESCLTLSGESLFFTRPSRCS